MLLVYRCVLLPMHGNVSLLVLPIHQPQHTLLNLHQVPILQTRLPHLYPPLVLPPLQLDLLCQVPAPLVPLLNLRHNRLLYFHPPSRLLPHLNHLLYFHRLSLLLHRHHLHPLCQLFSHRLSLLILQHRPLHLHQHLRHLL